MPRKALIIVDMLVDFIDRDGALYCGPGAEKIVPFIRKELDRFREAGDALIYLTDSHRPNDKEFRMFAKHCVTGTPGAEIIPELEPRSGEIVVRKPTISCFYRTLQSNCFKTSRKILSD